MASLFRQCPSASLFVPRTLRTTLPSTPTLTTILTRSNSTSTSTTNPINPIPTSTSTSSTPRPSISHAHHREPRPRSIAVGDPFPAIEIPEGSPAHKVNVRAEIEANGGEALIIGVPAAFTPTCSKSHIPGYLAFLDELPKNVFVLSVNDPFVMNVSRVGHRGVPRPHQAWKSTIEGAEEAGFRFLSDYAGKLAGALGLLFPSEKLFGNKRMARSVIYVNRNAVQGVWVEEDGTGLTGSTKAADVVRRISRLRGRPIKGVFEKEDAAAHPDESLPFRSQ